MRLQNCFEIWKHRLKNFNPLQRQRKRVSQKYKNNSSTITLSILFLKNGPTSASFFIYFRSFQTQILMKKLNTNGIRTRVVGMEGEHADHLITTTAQKTSSFCLHSSFANYNLNLNWKKWRLDYVLGISNPKLQNCRCRHIHWARYDGLQPAILWNSLFISVFHFQLYPNYVFLWLDKIKVIRWMDSNTFYFSWKTDWCRVLVGCGEGPRALATP